MQVKVDIKQLNVNQSSLWKPIINGYQFSTVVKYLNIVFIGINIDSNFKNTTL